MISRPLVAVLLVAATMTAPVMAKEPSFYVHVASDQLPADKAPREAELAGDFRDLVSRELKGRLPCARVTDDVDVRQRLSNERTRQQAGRGNDGEVEKIGGLLNVDYRVSVRVGQAGGKIVVFVNTYGRGDAFSKASDEFLVTAEDRDSLLEGMLAAAQRSVDSISGLPKARCPAWTGTVHVTVAAAGSDDKVSATGASTFECALKQDNLATCQVNIQGSIIGDGSKATTTGGGQVQTTIDVVGDDKVTTVKVGTFRVKTRTDVTIVLKADDGSSQTISNSDESERIEGGWEFTGAGSRTNRRAGSWTSPDGVMKARWDLAYQ
jgi:hypothetical protein